jgi:polyisoprenoid-binding protein YceI
VGEGPLQGHSRTAVFNLDDWKDSTFEGRIDATKVWTGEPDRDAHLRSADFFDVEHYSQITFEGRVTERTGHTHFKAEVDLTIRGVTRPVLLDAVYLGQWETPFWVGEENRGTMRRIGFEGHTRLDRRDFGVSWQDHLPAHGVVVSNEIDVTLDVEAILDEDLERTGAIVYYRDAKRVPSETKAGTPDARR